MWKLTNPETQMYSNRKTINNGTMKFQSLGTNFNLVFTSFNWTSNGGIRQSGVQSLDSMVAMVVTDLVPNSATFFGGVRNKNQNVAAWMAGTTSIQRSTFGGDIPNDIRPAQLSEPIIPAEPVPDDHAVITFLEVRQRLTNWFKQLNDLLLCSLCKSKTITC